MAESRDVAGGELKTLPRRWRKFSRYDGLQGASMFLMKTRLMTFSEVLVKVRYEYVHFTPDMLLAK